MKHLTVTFPLPGIWQVVTSPGDHVPSHYTEAWGMAYAFDFAKSMDVKISTFSRLLGVQIERCEAWNAEVISPVTGQVREVQRLENDRMKLSLIPDIISCIYPLLLGKKPINLRPYLATT